MHQLVLIRHGESIWNQDDRFTGWADIPLSVKGVEQAQQAGTALQKAGFDFDVGYTSVLGRAIWTMRHILERMERTWLPVHYTHRLNERHYGVLQGLNKTDIVQQYGSEQARIWRRSYDIQPPPLDASDPRRREQSGDIRYTNLKPEEIPLTECLKDTAERVLPYWHQHIAPTITSGKKVLIAAHGNSIRALIKHLNNLSRQEIINVDVPNGIPIIYELDDHLHPIRHHTLHGEPLF